MVTAKWQKAFTIVELALVMVVAALLLTGMLQPLGKALEYHRQQKLKAMLDTAAERIESFAMVNGRLPCPASETDPYSADYGIEDCGVVASEGPLPWRSLDLPENDPWGSPRVAAGQPWEGYLRYRVDPALAENTMDRQNISSKELTIIVLDGQGRQITNKGLSPAAIVCSHGRDKTANGENATTEPLPEALYQVPQVPGQDMDDQCVWISRLTLLHGMIRMQ